MPERRRLAAGTLRQNGYKNGLARLLCSDRQMSRLFYLRVRLASQCSLRGGVRMRESRLRVWHASFSLSLIESFRETGFFSQTFEKKKKKKKTGKGKLS